MPKHGQRCRLCEIYSSMINRCTNPKRKDFRHYGGRGITVCSAWLNNEKVPKQDNARKGYLAFKEWALQNGYKDDLTLDRIDVNGNYAPENCRWITWQEQKNNTRRNHLVTYKGVTKNIAQWSKELGLSYNTLRLRLGTLGHSVERAFTQPPQVRRKR